MNVTGIIAEYNPFHLGHAYHLAEARRLTGADFLIVIMSGDFVQRGEPALTDKYLRAQMALDNGADLVLELPVLYATAGSEDFAGGSVALLNRLGVVNTLCFGSESGDINRLMSAAHFLNNSSPEMDELIRCGLKEGLPYPSAVARAADAVFPKFSESADLLSSPNNLLAIEYCRALIRLSSAICPVTIKRLGSYHDENMWKKNMSERANFTSASALRRCFSYFTTDKALRQIRDSVPPSVIHLLEQEAESSFPMFADDFSDALFLRLLEHSSQTLSEILDISEDMAGRILKVLPEANSFTQLAETIKCKSYTRLRINRALIHCLLGISDQTMNEAKSSGFIHYGRILGFKESVRPLLKELSHHSQVPLIYQPAQADGQLSTVGKQMFSLDTFAAELYRMTAQRKFRSKLPEEYRRRIISV